MALTKKWAANGIKTPIPTDPQGDNLVNYDEGFTTPYKTPIKDGGVPIGMGTFNQLMYDITDEVIENKGTLNQVAQQVRGVIDDNQTTSTTTWSSVKISAEISSGGGSAVIDDNTITTDKVWSSFKTNQMVKGGKTISISNFQTKTATADTEFVNSSANAQVVNLNVKVKTTKGTTQGSDKYLGDIVVYYNSTAQEVLRESVISQNITGAPNDKITSALGSVILDAQDTLLVKGVPDALWTDAELEGYTANLTTEAPEPEPLGEGLIFTAQASSSSVTFNKQGTPTELQLEYQTIKADVTSGWQSYTLGTTINLDANDKVAFRNTGTQTITQTAVNYHYFTMAGEIKAENSISFLFDSTGTHDSIGEYECYKMFVNCSALAEMPDLPATNIAANGYANMFESCTKLKTIKPLNATTLGNYAYKEMFKNCSGIIISEGSGENQFLSMPAGAPSNAADNMFIGTSGRFTGTPTADKSYFYNATIPATDILRFTAAQANSTISLSGFGSPHPSALQLEYRIDTDIAWKDYTLGENLILPNINSWVELRNKGLQTITGGSTSAYHKFSMSGTISASGNLMYLLDKTGNKKNVDNYAFYNLFSGCLSLISAPTLPATNVGLYGYGNLFNRTSIKIAPELPATTLGNQAYVGMFYDCNDLTTPPSVLPATTIPFQAYYIMFARCGNLTSAPIIRATSIATSSGNGESAQSMFAYCPKLRVNENGRIGTLFFTCPPTVGADRPFMNMFSDTGGSFTGTPTQGNTYRYY